MLLDRDGVLVEDRSGYLLRLEDLRLEQGAAVGVAALAALGFQLAVVTNQACVGKGLLGLAELDGLHQALNRQLHGLITRFYVCPHRAGDGCACRKPEPGLLREARRDLGFDPAATWLVGDAASDVQAAQAAGCRPALVQTGKGARTAGQLPGIPLFADLSAFARFLAVHVH